MKNVLLILETNSNRETIIDVLKSFDVDLHIVPNDLEALKLTKNFFFDIIFIQCKKESLKCIQGFKKHNAEVILIAQTEEFDKQRMEETLKLGVKDCLNIHIGPILMRQRIQNYIELAELKKKRLFNIGAVNLFDKNIYQRMLTFKLNTNTSRVEFWEYFKDEHFKQYSNMQESINTLYALSTWMFLHHYECEVIKETGHGVLYLTLQPIHWIKEDILKNVIEKHNRGIEYLIDNDKLSLKLNQLIVLNEQEVAKQKVNNLDSDTKEILGKTHFNKVTAVEFVSNTAISFMDKIEDLTELEDKIDEAIIDFESEPKIQSAQLLADEISEYIEVIKLLVEFDHLVFALKKLAEAIRTIKEEQLEAKAIKKFTTLSLHLLNDLSTWRENIFIKQEANDIHYLDSSLLSSCLQIEAVFEKEKIEEDDGDFELF